MRGLCYHRGSLITSKALGERGRVFSNRQDGSGKQLFSPGTYTEAMAIGGENKGNGTVAINAITNRYNCRFQTYGRLPWISTPR